MMNGDPFAEVLLVYI